MADNVAITAGSGTTVAADDIGAGVLAQRVKPVWGVDGTGNDVNLTTPWPAQLIPQTSGGYTGYTRSSSADTNAQVVKASAGQVYGIQATNANTSARYLRLYNKATTPTVGTDTVVWQCMIPASGGIALSLPHGLPFTTGIAISLTSGAVNTDSTAVAADEIKLNLQYT